MMKLNIYTSLNLSDSRHLFGFISQSFDFVIFDLFYNVESCFNPEKDKKTREFIVYGKNIEKFAFYSEPLNDNCVFMFYGDYKSTNGLIYFAILQYNWRRKTFSLLEDQSFSGIFPVMSSSQFLFNNFVIFPCNQQKRIEIYAFDGKKLETKKTISSSHFSTVHWHVIEDVLYSFKSNDELNSCFLGTTSLIDQNETNYKIILGNVEWFEYSEFSGAWHLNRLYMVVTSINAGIRNIVFDLQTLKWTELLISNFARCLGSRLHYGEFLLTSSSSFVLNFGLNKNRCRKVHGGRIPNHLTFGKSDSLLFLTFMTLKKTKEMQKLLRRSPKVYQQPNFLNSHLWLEIANLYCSKAKRTTRTSQSLTPTRLSNRKRKNSGCECKFCSTI